MVDQHSFDMCVRNDLDRFYYVLDVIHRVPGPADRAAAVNQEMKNRPIARK